MKNKLEHQREYRLRTKNACTNRYEKTPSGFLMRKYRNMQSRVRGIQKLKSHLYLGLELLPKDVFYAWAGMSKEFKDLFSKWEESGYNRKLCPTVDRINPRIGYILPNMEWITHSENSRRGAIKKR